MANTFQLVWLLFFLNLQSDYCGGFKNFFHSNMNEVDSSGNKMLETIQGNSILKGKTLSKNLEKTIPNTNEINNNDNLMNNSSDYLEDVSNENEGASQPIEKRYQKITMEELKMRGGECFKGARSEYTSCASHCERVFLRADLTRLQFCKQFICPKILSEAVGECERLVRSLASGNN